MKLLVYISLCIYFSCYLFEGPIRYVLNMFGGDSLIFIRDLVILLTISFIFLRQYIRHELHLAFIIYLTIIGVHGIITMLNFGSIFVVIYSAKMLATILIGAVLAPFLMQPEGKVVKLILVLWVVTVSTIIMDKYIFQFPWTGMQATIGDVEVDITKNWETLGEDKRAAGLLRSSINAAVIVPIMAFIVIFNSKNKWLHAGVMLATIVALYCTTQKSSLLAFIITCGCIIVGYKRPVALLKIGITTAFLMMISLPLIMPHFDMPNESGVFSLGSFVMRIESVWPNAWKWIERRELFPFGVGLGGIGGAMRFYNVVKINPADNMFILLYAFFGVFSFGYMGWVWWKCIRVYKKAPPDMVLALSILSFILFYGCAMSMIEDQMITLFLGAAVAWLSRGSGKIKRL